MEISDTLMGLTDDEWCEFCKLLGKVRKDPPAAEALIKRYQLMAKTNRDAKAARRVEYSGPVMRQTIELSLTYKA